MTFRFEKERITALTPDGTTLGFMVFPRVRAGLVNISTMTVNPGFRGQGVEDAFPVLTGDEGGGVGLFVIAAHLGENLVVGNADGNGNSDFLFNTFPYHVGNFFSASEKL